MDFIKNVYAKVRHYQIEGFRVGNALCLSCHFKWIAAARPEEDICKLTCPSCKAENNTFDEIPLVKR